jgi:hypothetical protein
MLFKNVDESASGPLIKKNGITINTNNPDNQEGKLAFKEHSMNNNYKRTAITKKQFITNKLAHRSAIANGKRPAEFSMKPATAFKGMQSPYVL